MPRRRSKWACPATLATTPTSTPASTTPPPSASSCGLTIRCCPTTNGGAHRLPRPGLQHRSQRHGLPPAQRPNQSSRPDRTHFGPQPPPGRGTPCPALAAGRARVRALAQLIACEMHPLNNLRVLQYLKSPLGVDAPAKSAWYAHWLGLGFTALETMLQDARTSPFCHGDAPTLANCCGRSTTLSASRYRWRPIPACSVSAQPAES